MTKEHIYILDVLRFIAAVSVVIFHYTATVVLKGQIDDGLFFSIRGFTQHGNLGVNLFFIISGFVIFSSAIGRRPADFVISRIVRLYPAYWISVSLTAIIILLFGNAEVIVNWGKYLANLTMLNNYFGVKDIDGVYWTLQVELKFYFCIFLLLATGILGKFKYWITIWMFLTIIFYYYKQPFFMGWFISPEYSSYFIAGVVFYLARNNGFNLYYILVLLFSLFISLNYNFDRFSLMERVVGEYEPVISNIIIFIFYLLFAAISLRKLNVKNSKMVLYMGAITYPLYLLHNMIGKTVYSLFPGNVNHILVLVFIMFLMMTVSLLIYFKVEKKYSFLLKRLLSSTFNKLSGIYSGVRLSNK